MKIKVNNILFTLLIFAFLGCDGVDFNERILTKAAGRPGEIILVIDSVQWAGELGAALRRTLNVEVPGLGLDESLFSVRYIEPTLFNSVLNKTKNIIFVATLDSQTKGGSIVRNYMTANYIKENPDKYVISQQNIYASDQEVLYLFSPTASQLAERIDANPTLIRNFFNQKERVRKVNALYISNELTGVNNKMLEEHDYYLRIPNGYRIEANEPNFVWYRSPGQIDKNIFVYQTSYKNDEVFENANLIELRNEVAGGYIFEDPQDAGSYVTTDTVNVKPYYRSFKFNDKFTKEVRGIWRANNL